MFLIKSLVLISLQNIDKINEYFNIRLTKLKIEKNINLESQPNNKLDSDNKINLKKEILNRINLKFNSTNYTSNIKIFKLIENINLLLKKDNNNLIITD